MTLYATTLSPSMKLNENNDCAVKAVTIVTGLPYEDVHAVFKSRGRKNRKGTPVWMTQQVLKDLGFTPKEVKKDYKSKTVKTLENELPWKGRFLIRTARHILAYRASKVEDWTRGRMHRVVSIISVTRSDTMPKLKKATVAATKTATPKKTKAAKKKATPKKATPKKAAPKVEPQPTTKPTIANKTGLRKPQVRILKTLIDGKALTRAQISEKAPVDPATCTEYIGSLKVEVREANDIKHFPSLIGLKLVKVVPSGNGEGHAFQITATGKTTYSKAAAK